MLVIDDSADWLDMLKRYAAGILIPGDWKRVMLNRRESGSEDQTSGYFFRCNDAKNGWLANIRRFTI